MRTINGRSRNERNRAEFETQTPIEHSTPSEKATMTAYHVALILEKLLKGTIANLQKITDDDGSEVVLHRNNGDNPIVVREREGCIFIKEMSSMTKYLLAKRLEEMGHDLHIE